MKDLGELTLSAYVTATVAAKPLARALLAWRRLKGKEDPTRWRERTGEASLPRGAGPTVWVHSASVGETVAIMPLVHRIAATGLNVVMTTVTRTSASLLENRLPAGVCHQFVPLDIKPYVDRFLDAWDPQLAIFVESEIWPVTLSRLADRNIPLVISNARMSPRSFAGWMRWPSAAHAVFGRIRDCLAQSEDDAERFRELGVLRVANIGNIKFDAPVPEAPRTLTEALKAAVQSRPVLLAASTHPGEEEVVLDAFAKVLAHRDDLLLILAPRHPARSADVAALVTERGFRGAIRSVGALPGPQTQVYIADTVGELGSFYRLATVAFVGGSINPKIGGHNPIEPAGLGAAIVSGPHVGNWPHAYEALKEQKALIEVNDAEELYDAFDRLINFDNTRVVQVQAARRVVSRLTGALARTQTAMEPLIDPLIVSMRLQRQRSRPG
ncbi:3-deoxy-D-manno-octulosonic acid transferase [Hartmannibacter diazotrophicus]|uniref:3-deoxy-D-manno-octulosonic acid transferase n=1 Tax=Hartmannibacter diazotrophicus TaxID=1482074 RepID=A0A2C9D2T9_9HYPH|nr:3-deoxy-D-manno-octulosonic acid transferase [Hartmannibacter diazotrophicus]SON54647.1 3-deoxy-D-manno-octulosonic acid transferase [Hartmannibacter diazotrophicus]